MHYTWKYEWMSKVSTPSAHKELVAGKCEATKTPKQFFLQLFSLASDCKPVVGVLLALLDQSHTARVS